jgi:SSS family solute:Na+ symporter
MNLGLLDWSVVLLLLGVMIGFVFLSRTLVKSVTDFLATGRTGGRYIISMFQGTAALGAITVVGALEQNFSAGFNARWWEMLTTIILVGMSVTGWVVYRYRQTRVMTMAQFFEVRYSRSFRIFAGFLAFTSGLVNMIIFPSVTARFFIYYCGIPEIGMIGHYSITFILVAGLMVGIPLFFILTGGHIAVMFTDFVQGVFINIVFVAIVVLLLFKVDWTHIAQAMDAAPKDTSLINPFQSGKVQDFNIWYFFIGMFGLIYTKLAWQGNASFNVAAKNAHEAKMADLLTNWRLIPQWGLFMVFVPVVAYTIFNHPDFKSLAESINGTLAGAGNEAMKSQLRVPMVLNCLLPIGFKGAFAAIMLAAAITCHNTYMHSWGSIFIQDCIMPLRKKPFEQKQHLNYLKGSIFGVGLVIFTLSIVFQQTEKVFLFLAISGAIFVGGSGAVIIGGLYWARGTTAAAWSALLTGAVTATTGIVLNSVFKDFPINGQWFWFIAMVSSGAVYFIVSLLTCKKPFDMDKMLHRGAYAIKGETADAADTVTKAWKAMGITKEFTRGDKALVVVTYIWTAAWIVVFIIGTIYNLTHDVDNAAWMRFWKIYTWIYLVTSIIATTLLALGGVSNLREMIHSLRTMARDQGDSGFVRTETNVPSAADSGKATSLQSSKQA